MGSRSTPVIALFGGDEHTELAHALGAEIARRGCILLTGGGRGAPGPAVTESGLAGAEWLRHRAGVEAARVGVLGREHREVLVEVQDEGTRIVLGLALGDRRNYVNAHLCDAAIALEGGDGTKSEVAFCLALGRPVVLVGTRWGDEFPLDRSRAAYDAFRRAAARRVPGGGADELDRLIAGAYASLDSGAYGATHHAVHRSSGTPAPQLVEDALQAVGRAGKQGAFPELPELPDGARHGVAQTYEAWLQAVDLRLSAARGVEESPVSGRWFSSGRRGRTTRDG